MTRQEKIIIWCVIAVLLLVAILPYAYGWLTTPEGYYYTGQHRFSAADYNVYYSYMEQAKQGNWLFEDLYTTEQTANNFFSPVWLVGGLIAKTGLSIPIVFQILRIIAIPFLCLVLYKLISFFTEERRKRITAFVISLLAAGFGFYLYLIMGHQGLGTYYNYPLDLWVSEYSPFLTIMHSVHFIISLTLLLAVFLYMLRAWQSDKIKHSLYAGVASFFLLIIHAYHLPTVIIISFAWLIYFIISKKQFWRYIKHYLILLIFSAPPMVYWLWLYMVDPVFREKGQTMLNPMPTWWISLLSYGMVLILALVTLFFYKRNKKELKDKFILLWLWVIVQFLLVFLPIISFRRRLTEGLFVALAILATIGIYNLYTRIKKTSTKNFAQNRFIITVVFLFLFFASNFYVLSMDMIYMKENAYYFYLPQDLKESFDWLKKDTSKDEVTLSTFIVGNYLPAYSARKIYVGHGDETLDFEAKEQLAKDFYLKDENIENKIEFLQDNKLDYILYSDFQGNFDPEFNELPSFLTEDQHFKEVYNQGQTIIYRFND